jgi:hypothetical protein
VVKTDGKIYDSTGTTLQDMTSKAFNTLVTIKSDTAGTRRTLNAGLLNNSRYDAGLVFTELVFNDATANFSVKDAATTYGLDFQGCSGRLGHFRVVGYTANGIRLTQSAAAITCGATGSTWNITAPDFRLDNFTSHAAGSATGSPIVLVKARNVIFGGFDPGGLATPTGLAGSSTVIGAIKSSSAALDDVQDVVTGARSTPPRLSSTRRRTPRTGGTSRSRAAAAGSPGPSSGTPAGPRPPKPIYLGGGAPGSETAGNTTNALVTCDNPCTRDGFSQNPVNYTFRTGTTSAMPMEIDATVWDPAVPLTMWSSIVEQPTAVRFVDPRDSLGARPSGTSPAITNKATITSAFTIPAGGAGSVGRAGDGWFEIRGVKFDPGQPGAQIWIDGAGTKGACWIVDNTQGKRLIVAPAASQAGGVMPTIPLWTGSPGSGVTLKVTNPDGSAADFTKWPVPTRRHRADQRHLHEPRRPAPRRERRRDGRPVPPPTRVRELQRRDRRLHRRRPHPRPERRSEQPVPQRDPHRLRRRLRAW